MKHIDKTKLHAPASYEAQLRAAHLDEASILGGAHHGVSGDDLFDMVKRLGSYRAMKDQLLKDQGYVCCYCNRSIPIPGTMMITEHVKPKSLHRELVGVYKNLLVSCDGGNQVPAPYSRPTYPLHCDQAKGHTEIPVSPLMADCEDRVQYDPLSGEVKGDADVMSMVTILNLNHAVLTKERKDEIARWCYDSNGNVLSKAELTQVFETMLTPDSNGHFHNLYFVIASVAFSLAV